MCARYRLRVRLRLQQHSRLLHDLLLRLHFVYRVTIMLARVSLLVCRLLPHLLHRLPRVAEVAADVGLVLLLVRLSYAMT